VTLPVCSNYLNHGRELQVQRCNVTHHDSEVAGLQTFVKNADDENGTVKMAKAGIETLLSFGLKYITLR
jgi:hypothetical protein